MGWKAGKQPQTRVFDAEPIVFNATSLEMQPQRLKDSLGAFIFSISADMAGISNDPIIRLENRLSPDLQWTRTGFIRLNLFTVAAVGSGPPVGYIHTQRSIMAHSRLKIETLSGAAFTAPDLAVIGSATLTADFIE